MDDTTTVTLTADEIRGLLAACEYGDQYLWGSRVWMTAAREKLLDALDEEAGR